MGTGACWHVNHLFWLGFFTRESGAEYTLPLAIGYESDIDELPGLAAVNHVHV
jgi:hypothetical protein